VAARFPHLEPPPSPNAAGRYLASLIAALLVVLGLSASPAGGSDPAVEAAAPAGRLVQPKGSAGCIHRKGTNRCAQGRAVTSPEDIAISPDGRHAYVASYGSHGIAIFRRARRTGHLEQLPGRRGCVRHEGGEFCRAGRAMGGPVSIAVSPDGRNVYVASAGSDALSVFSRNQRTGVLTQLPGGSGCVSQRPGGGCVVGRALNEPTSVAVSPDGAHVYVTGRRFPSGLAVFDRAADGSVTQPAGAAGCVTHRGASECGAARAFASPEEVTVSPDSRFVLVAAMRSSAVSVLSQGPEGLTQAEGAAGCIANGGGDEGCAAGRGLAGPVDVTVTRDGRNVYTASSVGDAIAILQRNRATGALSQEAGRVGCISQGGGGGRCIRGRALDEVWSVAVSPDGRNVYGVSAKVNMLGAMTRDRSTGRLSQLPGRYGCFIRGHGGLFGCAEGRGLTVAVAVTVSPGGRNVYVTSEDTYLGSVAIFRRIAG
jgi:DNA-binding beta-propeller fold protein YncE